MNHSVASLYRAYLRQIRQLPHNYIQQFYRIKASDDIRAIANSPVTGGLRDRKTKRVSKDIRRIKAAVAGNSKAFAHVLDVAYGRKGKLRWELMEPLLTNPDAPLPPPIIPANPKSRPPVYSAELKALLTSGVSRAKALKPSALKCPPLMPARADPDTEDARLLGPFSKRREVNIRWRYFVAEWKKVRPPLHTVVKSAGASSSDDDRQQASKKAEPSLPREFGFHGLGVHEELESLTGAAWKAPPLTRRQRKAGQSDEKNLTASPHIRARWLRRRYQELLARVPILSHPGTKGGAFSVSVSPAALESAARHKHAWLPEADDVDLQWLSLSQAADEEAQKASRRKKTSAD
ncbi:hypothetical protein HGRIS_008130 [Hohenbuehelia grisea]|uniref:LYR motif-containing protein Cup1-like N-terminal domain-containing protein n=1 Tax=Hohenbuehelia grisea TaxID=104357 RepID=A0ABR3J7E8_9AGAR